MLSPVVVVGGRVAGTWRRTLGRERVTVSLSLFERPGARDQARIAAAAERYGAFLGLETELEGLTPRGSARTGAGRRAGREARANPR